MPAILVTLIFRTLDAPAGLRRVLRLLRNRPDTQTMSIYAQSTIVGDGTSGTARRSASRSS
jgi:hypothetical protein